MELHGEIARLTEGAPLEAGEKAKQDLELRLYQKVINSPVLDSGPTFFFEGSQLRACLAYWTLVG